MSFHKKHVIGKIAIKRNRYSFTLIELMLVIALISIGLGALALQASKALKGAQFEHGVEQLIDKISLAQEVMLDFHTNVLLTLKQQEGEVECQLEATSPLPSHIEKGLNGANKVRGIEQMVFNGTICSTIELQFEASLGAIPQGELRLVHCNRAAILTLRGYRAEIKQGDYETKTGQADYPKEIFSAL